MSEGVGPTGAPLPDWLRPIQPAQRARATPGHPSGPAERDSGHVDGKDGYRSGHASDAATADASTADALTADALTADGSDAATADALTADALTADAASGDAALPAWLRPLAAAAREVRAEQLSRFVPPPSGGRRSAVLILVGEDERGPTVLITERSHALRSHPGQPSFPGGRLDADEEPVAAALREAVEETGLDAAGVDIVAVMPDIFLPVGSSVVTPVVGWWREQSAVSVIDTAEVASVHIVSISELADPANRLQTLHPSGFLGPAFTVDGLLVWGFTAGLLDRVLHLGGFEQPWDTERVEPLPPDVVALAMRDRGAEAVPARREERP